MAKVSGKKKKASPALWTPLPPQSKALPVKCQNSRNEGLAGPPELLPWQPLVVKGTGVPMFL